MGLDPSKPVQQTIGRYDILEMIAEGGMGTVYKGRNRETGEIVAIKIVPPTAAKNPTLLKRFEREFTSARALDHPNVVKAIEFDASCPTPFLVMEYVDGESLGQKIEREGKMSEDEALRVIAEVSQGLYRAHKQGLIHRDVKPDNVLIGSNGKAKLTDLGLVKEIEGDFNLTKTGRGLGTPHFMAPEQFRDAKNADVRCDIYSLGATLYMMVTGQMPFGNVSALDCFMKKMRNDLTPPKEITPELNDRVDWAIRRAMSPNPDQRPSSCREFVEDLYGKSTRPQSQAVSDQAAADQDVWYLVYQDETGESHTVKGGTEGIRRALSENLLGDAGNIVACRHKQGPFLPLKNFPEFRDLIVSPEAMPPPSLTPTRGPTGGPVVSGPWPTAGTTPTANVDRLRSRANSATRNVMSATAPPRSTTSGPPHLKLPIYRRANFDVMLWGLVLIVALGTAFGVYYLFPPK
jgi:serine/threonine protein kinase